jgi:crotonobetainyl-CoA:carnitine CoA-transferase CaiB-like acyl-CoA transferase
MSPLLGCKVIDFSHMIAGPFATLYLAQLGATVTKIESPNGGDLMRRTRPGSTAFESFNAGKEFLQIDLKTPEGLAQALAIAAEADVFVDNFRPGSLERLGLGYDAVRAVNPRIVYCGISGYGRANVELAQRGAYDHIVQALTGMTMLAGVEGDPPIKSGIPVIDLCTGILGALAIVCALRERDRTGAGSLLDVSMWGAALQVLYPFVCDALTFGTPTERLGNQGWTGSPAADIFQCRDGWISIGANTTTQLDKLMTALGVAPTSPATPPATGAQELGIAQVDDAAALKALLRQAMAQASAHDLEQQLNDAGVPVARVRTVHEFVAEFRDRGFLVPTSLGSKGTLGPGLGWQVLR